MQNLRVFFSEHALLKSGIGNRFTFYCFIVPCTCTIQAVWMLDDYIEPDAWLYLFLDVCMRTGSYALNWQFLF